MIEKFIDELVEGNQEYLSQIWTALVVHSDELGLALYSTLSPNRSILYDAYEKARREKGGKGRGILEFELMRKTPDGIFPGHDFEDRLKVVFRRAKERNEFFKRIADMLKG